MKARDCNCSHCRVAQALAAGDGVLLYSRAELDAVMGSGVLAGRAVLLDVLHDDECAMEPCSCSPWFSLRPLTALSLTECARRAAS